MKLNLFVCKIAVLHRMTLVTGNLKFGPGSVWSLQVPCCGFIEECKGHGVFEFFRFHHKTDRIPGANFKFRASSVYP